MPDHDPYAADSSVKRGGDTKKAKSEAPKSTSQSSQSSQSSNQSTGVPTGSSKEIMDWVGSDKTRANAAMQQERKSDQPRKTLMANLDEVLKK